MTIKEASRKLGIGEQAVRVLMRRGKLPIGICKKEDGNLNWRYIIFPKWVDLWLEGTPVTIPEGLSDMEGQ